MIVFDFFSKVPAFLHVTDIAGLVEGAHEGQVRSTVLHYYFSLQYEHIVWGRGGVGGEGTGGGNLGVQGGGRSEGGRSEGGKGDFQGGGNWAKYERAGMVWGRGVIRNML